MEGLAFYSEIFVIYILSFLFEFLYLPFNSLNPKKFNPLLFSTWKLFLQPAILKILSPPNDFQHNHLLLFYSFICVCGVSKTSHQLIFPLVISQNCCIIFSLPVGLPLL